MIFASGCPSRIICAASRPSMPGMMMSIVTTSGRISSYRVIASSPFSQYATTS